MPEIRPAGRAFHPSGPWADLATEETDEALWRRYRRGDAEAFERLMGRHRGPVYTMLVRLTGDRARAEDLLQETWMRVLGAAARWEERARFRTWLYTVARNLAADEARRARHRRTDPLDADPPGGDGRPAADRLADPAPGPDRAAESARLRPVLEAALAALPDEQREVFVLREYAGVPFAEIAEITGAPEPTVKSRMRYALEALRRTLADRGVVPSTGTAAAAPGGTGTGGTGP
jgi:RNA polymerase sigma-70 factor (ECF subfamily)